MATDPALAPALDALRSMGGLGAERSLDGGPFVEPHQNHIVAAHALLKRASSEEDIPVVRNVRAVLAQTHATLALETQMKRIADALEHMDAMAMRRD